jgi:hypothetical protein
VVNVDNNDSDGGLHLYLGPYLFFFASSGNLIFASGRTRRMKQRQIFYLSLVTLRIPIYSGRVFRREAGHRSDLKPATIPK